MKATVSLNTGQPPAGTVSFNVNGAKVGSAAVTGAVASVTATVPVGATTTVMPPSRRPGAASPGRARP